MREDNTALIRQLIPKSLHFDAYNEINCQNSRDKPFFSNNSVSIGKYVLTTRLVNKDTLTIEFESICPYGNISFETYTLTLREFVSKLQEATRTNSDFIYLKICVNSNLPAENCKNCSYQNKNCKYFQSNEVKEVYAAVSFKKKDVEDALACYFKIKTSNIKNKGERTMRSNDFLSKIEFGVCKDSNIIGTLMGVAVRNQSTGEYKIYNRAEKKITNMANMTVGNFPVLLVPATREQMHEGELFKSDGHYYFLEKVNDDKTVTCLAPDTGEIKQIMLSESFVPGFNFYTKVIAMDPSSLTASGTSEGVAPNIFAAMLMMGWANKDYDGGFSLDSIDDDSFNGLGNYLPLLIAGNGNLQQMFPYMIMFGKNTDDSMKAMMLMSILTGNTSNPFSGILHGVDPVGSATNSANDKVMCEHCHTTYDAGTNFCPVCGNKTVSMAKKCKACGAVLVEGAAYCQNCGAKVSSDVCPKCGAHVENGQKFCSACGTSLSAPPAKKPATKKKSTPKVASTPKVDDK